MNVTGTIPLKTTNKFATMLLFGSLSPNPPWFAKASRRTKLTSKHYSYAGAVIWQDVIPGY